MSYQNQKMPINSFGSRLRLLVLVGLMLTFFGILIYRYYVLQIDQADKWALAARKQHFFVVDEPFVRGSIYSSSSVEMAYPGNGKKLVSDIPKFHLYADPKSLPDNLLQEIAFTLRLKLDLDLLAQYEILKQLSNRRSRCRKLALWLDAYAKETILQWWNSFARQQSIPRNALYFVSDYQRGHPYEKLAGQLLQTVQSGRDEKTGQAIPTGGLELSLDRYLRGKKGKRLLMRSPTNIMEIGEVIEEPQNGADVHLTIDLVLQAIVEEELAKAVHRTHSKTGWAVMMNPFNGEVLAFAQYPFYNPENYAEYFNKPSMREEAKVKAITDAHEPGSVMKPISLAIAFLANDELKKRGEAPLFDPNEKMATHDGRFPGRRPLKEVTYHSFLDMNMAMHRSSNIYFARLIQRVIDRLGNGWYREQLHTIFGFGMKTHIELPGESIGLLPTPGKIHSNGTLEWSVPTPFSMAIGHNIQATSLQLLRAYALFANGGYLVQPTLLKKIIRPGQNGHQDEVLLTTNKSHVYPQVIKKETLDPVIKAMKYVTKKGGCASRAEVPGFTECGKTGTAEKIVRGTYSRNDHVTTFVGFTPVDKPAFVLLVTIDEPKKIYIPGIGKNYMGSYAAAPVFREIAKRSLAYLGIPPDDPFGYPVGDPRYDSHKADWIKEVDTLHKLYREWNAAK